MTGSKHNLKGKGKSEKAHLLSTHMTRHCVPLSPIVCHLALKNQVYVAYKLCVAITWWYRDLEKGVATVSWALWIQK